MFAVRAGEFENHHGWSDQDARGFTIRSATTAEVEGVHHEMDTGRNGVGPRSFASDYFRPKKEASTYSAYGTSESAAFCRALSADRSRQKTRRIPQEAPWRFTVRRVLSQNRIATINAVPSGAVSAEHHGGSFGKDDETAEGVAPGCVWRRQEIVRSRF